MSWTARLAEGAALALGAAVVVAVPTMVRVARVGGASPLDGLLVGAATLLVVLFAARALVRAARRGFRGVGLAPSVGSVAGRLGVWAGLSVVALIGLGALLKKTTHHRGLAGATFGVLGLVSVGVAALVAARFVPARRAGDASDLDAPPVGGASLPAAGGEPAALEGAADPAAIARARLVTAGFAGAAVVAALLGALVGGAAGDASLVRAAVVDAVAAVLATAAIARVDLSDRAMKHVRIWAVPLATAVLIAGGMRAETQRALGSRLRAAGGLPAVIVGAIERWTDRDGDGQGAYFGGHDCDEGDPTRHPGATDAPGDGVDQDCDGVDPPRPPTVTASGGPFRGGGKSSRPVEDEGPPPNQPDIVLVTLDTVRADHTSAYGYGKPTTPTLAAMAARGFVFEHAYTTGPSTQRAIAPLVTGRRLSHSARTSGEWPTLKSDNDTLAERLRRAGYATAGVTSFTWMMKDRGFSQGFDSFDAVYALAHPEREVTGDHAVKAASDAIEMLATKKRAPFFLWVHLFDAHEKYVEHRGLDFGKGRTAAYDAEVAFVDAKLRQIELAVEKTGRAGRTLFVVHGSHGEALGEHRTLGHGDDVFEEATRVPFVLAGAGVAHGKDAARAVSTLDIVPTLLDVAGASTEGVEGNSLAASLKGDPAACPEHPPVFVRAPKRGAVIDWPLKLVVTDRKRKGRYALYDLAADPTESRDVAAQRTADVERLRKVFEAYDADSPRRGDRVADKSVQ